MQRQRTSVADQLKAIVARKERELAALSFIREDMVKEINVMKRAIPILVGYSDISHELTLVREELRRVKAKVAEQNVSGQQADTDTT